MSSILNLFFRLWVLRANPQDLPSSKMLTQILVAIFLFASLLSYLFEINVLKAFAASVVDLVLLLATVHTLLLIAKVPERGYQSASAVLATSIVLVVVSTLIMLIVGSNEIRSSLLLVLLAWYLLIFGHILRQAIALPILLGALIALLYMMVSAGAISYLFFPLKTGGQ